MLPTSGQPFRPGQVVKGPCRRVGAEHFLSPVMTSTKTPPSRSATGQDARHFGPTFALSGTDREAPPGDCDRQARRRRVPPHRAARADGVNGLRTRASCPSTSPTRCPLRLRTTAKGYHRVEFTELRDANDGCLGLHDRPSHRTTWFTPLRPVVHHNLFEGLVHMTCCDRDHAWSDYGFAMGEPLNRKLVSEREVPCEP